MSRLALFIIALLAAVTLYFFIENQSLSAKVDHLSDKNSMYEFMLGKTKRDTVREIHHYHTTVNNVPYKIEVQAKPDTAYRHKLEKGTLVTGVKFKDGEVDVQTSDSAGHLSEEKHKIKEGSTVTIDSAGGVNEKKQSPFKSFKLYIGGEAGLNTLAPQVFLTTPKGWAINANYDILHKRTNVGLSKRVSFNWIKRNK